MAETVVEAASTGERLTALRTTADVLVEAIEAVDAPQVPALAARLVDVLKRIGGSDPEVLRWLRDVLARAIDRLRAVQGEKNADGKPLGTELAPMVRQFVATVEALDGTAAPSEVSPLDEIAAARARRTAGRSGTAGLQRSS